MDNNMLAIQVCAADYIDLSSTQDSEEVFDADFLNNYNMTDNIDEQFDHTFLNPNINVPNINEGLYFSENDINSNFNHSNNLSFIDINSIHKNLKKYIFISKLKHEIKVICCSESWLKNSTMDRYNSCFIELDKHTINNRKKPIILGCIYIYHLVYQ